METFTITEKLILLYESALLFKFIVLQYQKSGKNIWLLHVYIFQESCSVVLKHLRVSLAKCVIIFHQEHLFYIDINKNYHFLFQFACKKYDKSFTSDTFCGQTHRRHLMAGVGLGSYDRQTVVSMGVNLSWLKSSLRNRRMIV